MENAWKEKGWGYGDESVSRRSSLGVGGGGEGLSDEAMCKGPAKSV